MKLPLSIACLVLAVCIAYDVRTNGAALARPAFGATVEVLAIDEMDPAAAQQMVARFPDRMTSFARLAR